jgi:hypothetical protein
MEKLIGNLMKLVFATLLAAVAPVMTADIYDFSVLHNSGAITGVTGSSIGWGYSIHNESSSLWLVTTELDSGVFQHGTPDLLFDFPAIASATTVTVPFDVVKGAGLAELTGDSSAPGGFSNSGNFVLSADWWSGDPLGAGRDLFAAPASVQSYVASVATPEPATIALISLPLLACGLLRRKSNRAHC